MTLTGRPWVTSGSDRGHAGYPSATAGRQAGGMEHHLRTQHSLRRPTGPTALRLAPPPASRLRRGPPPPEPGRTGWWPAWPPGWPTTSTSTPPWSGSGSSPSPCSGGLAVPLYLAGWLLIPEEEDRPLGGRGAAGPASGPADRRPTRPTDPRGHVMRYRWDPAYPTSGRWTAPPPPTPPPGLRRRAQRGGRQAVPPLRRRSARPDRVQGPARPGHGGDHPGRPRRPVRRPSPSGRPSHAAPAPHRRRRLVPFIVIVALVAVAALDRARDPCPVAAARGGRPCSSGAASAAPPTTVVPTGPKSTSSIDRGRHPQAEPGASPQTPGDRLDVRTRGLCVPCRRPSRRSPTTRQYGRTAGRCPRQ